MTDYLVPECKLNPEDKNQIFSLKTEMILSPFIATNTCGKFDVTVAVEGGGVTGKAGAIRHGIIRIAVFPTSLSAFPGYVLAARSLCCFASYTAIRVAILG